MKSLIVGMGIGNLYHKVLTNLGHEIVTVDLDPNKAQYTTVHDAINDHEYFDTSHICTPNFTHRDLAYQVAESAKIVFIEKPGLRTAQEWQDMVKSFPHTRFMMVKNNMWRSNISELQQQAQHSHSVNIEWLRKNCIPSPGSWFTTRELAFGGVSRDLMPHLLSLYVALNPNWQSDTEYQRASLQNWLLSNIDSTEYGQIYPDGVYDVDDHCAVSFTHKWNLTADWRTMNVERSAITFVHEDNSRQVFELGWCPEQAYLNMIKDAVDNLNNGEFWSRQYDIDTWIHERIQQL